MIVKIEAYQLDQLDERYPMSRLFTLPMQLIDGEWACGRQREAIDDDATPSAELVKMMKRLNLNREVIGCVAQGNTLRIDIWKRMSIRAYHEAWRKLIPQLFMVITDYLQTSVGKEVQLTVLSDAFWLEMAFADQLRETEPNRALALSP